MGKQFWLKELKHGQKKNALPVEKHTRSKLTMGKGDSSVTEGNGLGEKWCGKTHIFLTTRGGSISWCKKIITPESGPILNRSNHIDILKYPQPE